mmetsp:Transcript_13427/g.37785  ORF Transcript_13427/g.37785 Transcript_13427/m.37785 type:complete len:248 (-) Transcript_13427:505-1248(-)
MHSIDLVGEHILQQVSPVERDSYDPNNVVRRKVLTAVAIDRDLLNFMVVYYWIEDITKGLCVIRVIGNNTANELVSFFDVQIRERDRLNIVDVAHYYTVLLLERVPRIGKRSVLKTIPVRGRSLCDWGLLPHRHERREITMISKKFIVGFPSEHDVLLQCGFILLFMEMETFSLPMVISGGIFAPLLSQIFIDVMIGSNGNGVRELAQSFGPIREAGNGHKWPRRRLYAERNDERINGTDRHEKFVL